jgi:hypothetical protein
MSSIKNDYYEACEKFMSVAQRASFWAKDAQSDLKDVINEAQNPNITLA